MIWRSDLLVLPLFGDQKPFPFLESPFVETRGQFSPDGKSMAIVSNESGRAEVFVQSFPEERARTQVSTGGGAQIRALRPSKAPARRSSCR